MKWSAKCSKIVSAQAAARGRQAGQQARPRAVAGERGPGPAPAGCFEPGRQRDRGDLVGAPNVVREVVCRSWASDGLAVVSIRCPGPGIPSDCLERLFEPFFTTKHDGMGMGLCIAHSILEVDGGRISAEGRPHGAVFRVSLPSANT